MTPQQTADEINNFIEYYTSSDALRKHMQLAAHDYAKEVLLKHESMGISGKVSHDPRLARKYNALLEMLGTEGLLHQIELWMDDSDLENIITDIENNIF
jgi:hypothetical protein